MKDIEHAADHTGRTGRVRKLTYRDLDNQTNGNTGNDSDGSLSVVLIGEYVGVLQGSVGYDPG